MSTLFGRFRECAVRHPELPAIEVADAGSVRYRELLDLVERLAGRLVAVAGRPPVAVGLLAARSLAAFAGYLAALRVAAAAVPLHPGFPLARNELMCRSATVDIIVADDAGSAQLPTLAARTGAAAVPLRSAGTPWYWTLDTPPLAEPYRGRPEDIAYTLFTSGSTGRPKGVPIRHRNLERYLRYCIDRYALGPGARYALAAELTFDQSVSGMFACWGSGATVVVPRPEELLDPARFVVTRRISHWRSVPSLISIPHRHRMLPPASMPDLRFSLFGGERLTLDAAGIWAAAAPASAIVNVYGPTELTVDCSAYRLPADPARWPVTPNGTVPIGPVHPHLERVVLTEDGHAGGQGELCVRGPQMFDGYLDRADDRGRFVRRDGAVWYRTGDRVRVGADGVMVHLGRLDDQLKVRGYRIEPGEVEAVLRSHPKLTDAVVLAAGETLHAVYTGDPVDPDELAALAGERLPPYQVPAGFRHLDELPVNANGKVDRLGLAAELAGQA